MSNGQQRDPDSASEDQERASYAVYNPEPERETTRGALARGLLWLLSFVIGGVLVFIGLGRLEGTVLTQSVFPSLIALAGTALGFYFGAQAAKNGGSSTGTRITESAPPTKSSPTQVPAPSVAEITPSSGSKDGGTSVTIKGSGFVNGATVKIDGALATNVNVVDSSSITATTPAHQEGKADVIVINPDNQQGVLVDGYTYLPTW